MRLGAAVRALEDDRQQHAVTQRDLGRGDAHGRGGGRAEGQEEVRALALGDGGGTGGGPRSVVEEQDDRIHAGFRDLARKDQPRGGGRARSHPVGQASHVVVPGKLALDGHGAGGAAPVGEVDPDLELALIVERDVPAHLERRRLARSKRCGRRGGGGGEEEDEGERRHGRERGRAGEGAGVVVSA
jgi:hypothetical protein